MSKGKATTKTTGKRVAARKPGVQSRPARASANPAQAASTVPAFDSLSNAQKLNPTYLAGENLRDLGYNMGLARSLMAAMDDQKIRRELNLIAHRNAREEAAEAA